MIRAILIDDEAIALDVLEITLGEIGGVSVVGKYQIATEAMARLGDLEPHLIFLDIEMPGMNGLAAGELISQQYPNVDIIFVTAYHQYALDAFETNAIDYVLKPVSRERLAKTLDKFRFRNANRLGVRETGAVPILQLKVLGSLELCGPDGQLIAWRTRKTKELFAYLWHHGGELVYKYHILDDLWPNLDAERAQTIFHTTMYNLRNTLKSAGFADMVSLNDERYRMRDELIRSDVDRLMELIKLVKEGARTEEVVGELLELYRGDYLEMDHYDWAVGRSNEMRAMFADCLDQVAQKADGQVKSRLLRRLAELE